MSPPHSATILMQILWIVEPGRVREYLPGHAAARQRFHDVNRKPLCANPEANHDDFRRLL